MCKEMIILKSKIWVDLIYNGNKFDRIFQISDKGEIRNVKTKNILNGSWENRIYYSMICWKNKVYRIKVGEAQVESKLVRTIFDKPRKYPIESDLTKSKRPAFTKRQLEELNIIKADILKEVEDMMRTNNYQ